MKTKPINKNTQFDIIQKGYRVLHKEMGPTDSIRFIMSFNSGSGDSVKEFQKFWQGKSIAQIANKIKSN